MEDFHLQAVDHARHTEKTPHEAGPGIAFGEGTPREVSVPWECYSGLPASSTADLIREPPGQLSLIIIRRGSRLRLPTRDLILLWQHRWRRRTLLAWGHMPIDEALGARA
jgi:hypothetical protein